MDPLENIVDFQDDTFYLNPPSKQITQPKEHPLLKKLSEIKETKGEVQSDSLKTQNDTANISEGDKVQYDRQTNHDLSSIKDRI
eukprot:13188246-Ditylum_brightwellii.AAC.1